MRLRPILAVTLLLASWLSGCSGLDEVLGRPCGPHQLQSLKPGEWNREGLFRVIAGQPVAVRIEAEGGGELLTREGVDDVSITLPDGTWTVRYWIDGTRCNTLEDVRVDGTPPAIENLETLADAPDGRYELGAGASVKGHVFLEVIDLRTRIVLGHKLPIRLEGLASGLQAYLVSAHDAAGNYANVTVQVRVGVAAELPDGKYTFGVVARYTNQVRLWDISKADAYLPIAAARLEAGDEFLDAGFGITPDDAEVKRVVAEVVKPDMNSMRAALALYRYMADRLEYDETRLDSETLLTPRQVLLDAEDSAGKDCADANNEDDAACDGLVSDGAGNGVRGGICRDLAATYVSLLRAAGIPARLVSGYVGGTVNGFHAWVEFYAGARDGQSPWVPVDVSTIDGPYSVEALLQAFGLQRPEYLPLRQVPAASEQPGWSTALSVHYTWPQGQGKGSPDIRFGKDVRTDFTHTGALCVNTDTLARLLADDTRPCGNPTYGKAFDDFVRQTERTIDYGVQVVAAAPGTNVRAEVAYPFEADVEPDLVVYRFYGPSFEFDETAGKVVAEFWPNGR